MMATSSHENKKALSSFYYEKIFLVKLTFYFYVTTIIYALARHFEMHFAGPVMVFSNGVDEPLP